MVQAFTAKPKTTPQTGSSVNQSEVIVSAPVQQQPLPQEPMGPVPSEPAPPSFPRPSYTTTSAPPMTIQDAMMMDWWEERQRRQRAAQAQAHQAQQVQSRPASMLSGVNQIRQYAREMTEFQKALADLSPAPKKNIVIEFFDSNAGGTLMNNFGQMMQQMIIMWKEERQMKRQAMQVEQYQKTYEAMLAKHNQALQMRANAGSPTDIPPPPGPMPPDYNGMVAGYGQQPGQVTDPTSQLAQMYAAGQVPAPGNQQLAPPPPLYQDPNYNMPPPPLIQGAMGVSRPRGLEPDASIPGVGATQYAQPNLQTVAAQQQAEIERLKAQLLEQQDRLALLGPSAANPSGNGPKPGPKPPEPTPAPKDEKLTLAEVVEETKQ